MHFCFQIETRTLKMERKRFKTFRYSKDRSLRILKNTTILYSMYSSLSSFSKHFTDRFGSNFHLHFLNSLSKNNYDWLQPKQVKLRSSLIIHLSSASRALALTNSFAVAFSFLSSMPFFARATTVEQNTARTPNEAFFY